MDMIEKVEFDEALKNQAMIRRRIGEVAARIAILTDIFGEVKSLEDKVIEPRDIELNGFGMEPYRDFIRADISLLIDDDDGDDYRRISRNVSFPFSYLNSEGWEEEAAARGRDSKRWYARYHIASDGDVAVRRAEAELVRVKARYAELLKLASEHYETREITDDDDTAPRYKGLD